MQVNVVSAAMPLALTVMDDDHLEVSSELPQDLLALPADRVMAFVFELAVTMSRLRRNYERQAVTARPAEPLPPGARWTIAVGVLLSRHASGWRAQAELTLPPDWPGLDPRQVARMFSAVEFYLTERLGVALGLHHLQFDDTPAANADATPEAQCFG
tara:strand:+ start:839 stop:1309 length:471 start_codon:yes stop_codon:yes gene_type:complete